MSYHDKVINGNLGPFHLHTFKFGVGTAVTTTPTDKIMMKGNLEVKFAAHDQAKFGPEIIFNVWLSAEEAQVEARKPGNKLAWCRTEICFPVDQVDLLIETLQKIRKMRRA